jgi:hypothetical protein
MRIYNDSVLSHKRFHEWRIERNCLHTHRADPYDCRMETDKWVLQEGKIGAMNTLRSCKYKCLHFQYIQHIMQVCCTDIHVLGKQLKKKKLRIPSIFKDESTGSCICLWKLAVAVATYISICIVYCILPSFAF